MGGGARVVAEYFETIDQRFAAAAAQGVDAIIQWDLSGPGGGAWHVVVADGEMELFASAHDNPTVTIHISAENYGKLLSGELSGPMAIMTRKMKVTGNVRMARKMDQMFPRNWKPEPGAAKKKATPKKATPKKAAPKKAAPKKAAPKRAAQVAPVAEAAERLVKSHRVRGAVSAGPPLAVATPPREARKAGGEWTPTRVLVTGGAGFIGSHAVRHLLDQGMTVRVLTQPGANDENLHGLNVERAMGDLLDTTSLARACDGVDTVLHFAAIYAIWLPDPALMYQVNVGGTINLIDAARAAGVGRFVHCSSFSTIGEAPDTGLSDEGTLFNHWGRADHYVMSKYLSELEAQRRTSDAMPIVVVNPAFPFGDHDVAPTPTGVLVQRFAYGQSPVILKGGFNAVDVRDVAKGALLAARRGRSGERYILGSENVTYREFGNMVCDIAGEKRPRWEISVEPLARLGRINEWISDNITHRPPVLIDKGLRFTGGRFLYCSTDKARNELGYEPAPIEQAIEDAVSWFKARR